MYKETHGKENLSSLAASEDWIHAKPSCGGGGGVGLHPFCFISYFGLVLSPSRLRTRMSRDSSLESPGLSAVHWE